MQKAAFLIPFLMLLFYFGHPADGQNKIIITTNHYTVDSTYDALFSPEAQEVLYRYKPDVDSRIAQKIGESAQTMTAVMPESLLTNFATDVLLEKGAQYLEQEVDLSILNIGGFRAAMPEGNITLGDIYDIFPFDNVVEVLYIKGKYLRQLFDFFAEQKMQPVGNTVLKIRSKKLEEALIGGEVLDDEKTYKVVTLNYLRKGGDGMGILDHAEEVVNTRIQFRDVITEYISEKYKRHEKIDASLDNRVIIY